MAFQGKLLGRPLRVDFKSLNDGDLSTVEIILPPDCDEKQYVSAWDLLFWVDDERDQKNLPDMWFRPPFIDGGFGDSPHRWNFLYPGSTILVKENDNMFLHIREVEDCFYLTLQAIQREEPPNWYDLLDNFDFQIM